MKLWSSVMVENFLSRAAEGEYDDVEGFIISGGICPDIIGDSTLILMIVVLLFKY